MKVEYFRGVKLLRVGAPLKDLQYIAIAGTRWPSDRAYDVAYDLAHLLTYKNFGIVTGLADGIDTAAAYGAIDAGGVLVGVAPCIYFDGTIWRRDFLKYNNVTIVSDKKVCSDIARDYALRNGVIAYIAHAVVIPEARCPTIPCPPRGWGTLHVVRHAKKYGKPVILFAPMVRDPEVRAAYAYLKRYGAITVESVEETYEVIREL